jgi:hypothetical protein
MLLRMLASSESVSLGPGRTRKVGSNRRVQAVEHHMVKLKQQ